MGIALSTLIVDASRKAQTSLDVSWSGASPPWHVIRRTGPQDPYDVLNKQQSTQARLVTRGDLSFYTYPGTRETHHVVIYLGGDHIV
ncbi:hypothetical protein HH308_11790 [Gordonia sp. TBRC 11910]|uniref:NlpC/P60 family protein n=1 Tax=Gordonia asplenii TaxID=2725283 RepID=A0A848KUE4_9ACTN|nr:NlpC/P60 family protein [Gordonia asplenii]NMO01892.1 hypothetical protein [Gordonia asplenii]